MRIGFGCLDVGSIIVGIFGRGIGFEELVHVFEANWKKKLRFREKRVVEIK